MGHSIAGFIAKTEVLREGTAHLRSAVIAPLEQGLAFLPTTGELDEELGGGEEPYEPREEFWHLRPALERLGAAMSARGRVAYVETDYFGGAGDQAAMVWEDGEVLSPPSKSRIGPVSDALRRLGAEKGEAHDEFDAVGLGRHRRNDGWIEAAGGEPPSS